MKPAKTAVIMPPDTPKSGYEMAKQKYITDWICIATEGYAIDGRPITREMIQQAADNYSTAEYTAMIWPNHPVYSLQEREFTFNLGLVSDLAAKEDAGRLRLMAKLEPNQALVNLNERGQKLFTSCEFWENYANTGKTYLYGLAATDSPASLGTQRIEIKSAETSTPGSRPQYAAAGNIEMFSLGRLTPVADTTTNHHEEESMTKEQANQLLAQIVTMTAKIDAQANTQPQAQQPAAADAQPVTRDFSAHANLVADLGEKLIIATDTLAANPEDATARQNYTAVVTELQTALSTFAVQPQDAETVKLQARIAARNGGQQPAPAAAQNFSTHSTAKDDEADAATLTTLTSAIENLSQRFSVIEGQRTPTPGAAPSGQPAQFEPL
ncbi:GPO family capsid scaffolding protein [Salmonella enterica]|nr:capsid scaffolding protein [Salmonella enterica subsp. enterica serovar Bareilly]EHU7413961.1 GPO family capsid scaffolding protein [Salmonella enterica]EKL9814478.1 GPO family capsid scaffolding protein [Salmonella enterica]EMD1216879.1 GPO family capsid scaffolding protein [Salmonella enterica]